MTNYIRGALFPALEAVMTCHPDLVVLGNPTNPTSVLHRAADVLDRVLEAPVGPRHHDAEALVRLRSVRRDVEPHPSALRPQAGAAGDLLHSIRRCLALARTGP